MDWPKAYLAGPDVFLSDPVGMAEKKKAICAEVRIQGVSPIDSELGHQDRSDLELAMAISRGNEALMDDCDLIIANMTPFRGPSIDAGTSYEMGYMRGCGKPVFGYTNSTTSYFERVRQFYSGRLQLREDDGRIEDPSHMQVENFGLLENLMLEGAVRQSGKDKDITICASHAPEESIFEDLEAFRKCVALVAKTIGLKRA